MGSSNFYFNNFSNSMEQDLIESLIVESISIYGHSVYYCPRNPVKIDQLYGEAPISVYNNAYEFDMYIRSYDNYEGDGTFLSKFNLEIRDQTTFTVARRTFYNEIGQEANLDRPQEGDLVYSTMMKRLFIIKYVKNTPIFYQMGSLQVWDCVCEVFEYSNERLETGIAEIDAIEDKYSFDESSFGILTNDNYRLTANDGGILVLGQFDYEQQLGSTEDNTEIDFEGHADNIIDWTEIDPFSEGML